MLPKCASSTKNGGSTKRGTANQGGCPVEKQTSDRLTALADLAVQYNINIVAGSLPEYSDHHLRNVCYLLRRDGTWDYQYKLHPTPDEDAEWALTGGDQLKIFDTTLRDGEQSPGCSMNLHEKLEVAKQLERLKVDVIEAGFPPLHLRFFMILKKPKETIILYLILPWKESLESIEMVQ